MPIDERLRAYAEKLSLLLDPCEPIESYFEPTRIIIVATKKVGATLCCPRCGQSCSSRGSAQTRLIRHLNFEGLPVWVDVSFPRVYCGLHGHLIARQSFCDPRCRISHGMEEAILESIWNSSESEIELKRKFGLRGPTLARILHRVCERTKSLKASPPQK